MTATMRIVLAVLLLWVLPATAQQSESGQQSESSQQPVTTLVADLVEVEGENRIVASGNVEIFSDGRSLSAQRLSYDRSTGEVSVTGPIVLQDGEDLLVFADAAELDTELRDGVLRGARIVLARQLQIAGAELRRTEGRFNELRSVAASSCEVCVPGTPPLWDIRARRVIHDEENARVYFYDARFRIVGTPVFYLPVLRLPDGTRDRVSGVLTPSVRTTTQLGPGIKIPYFFTLGRSADLTLTPYIATDYTRTMEFGYRQLFRTGELAFEGAISRDSIEPGETRGYLFGAGFFDLPRDFELGFTIETTTDDAYLSDYDYSSADRLENKLGVLRTRDTEREMIGAEVVYFQSLRTDEDNDTTPTLVGDARYLRRWQIDGVGGWLDVDVRAHAHERPSNENIVGRDMAQLRATAAWSRIWTGDTGLRLASDLLMNGDLKYIFQDDRYQTQQAALTPTAAVRLSWPLVAHEAGDGGATYLLEPVGQLVWTKPGTLKSPNDDSTLIAYDTGNLFGLNRFPGLDRYEEGGRANLALRWSRIDAANWTVALTLGKTYRAKDFQQFPPSTGLSGTSSDWMVQADVDFGTRLAMRNLLLLDTGFEPTLNETRLSWQGQGLELDTTYVWQRADRALDLDEDLSELAFDAAYEITDNWSTEVDVRRDLTGQQTNRAELGLTWQNECVRVDLSALRRFRNTNDVEATTSYGFSVALAGFGATDTTSDRTRRCTR